MNHDLRRAMLWAAAIFFYAVSAVFAILGAADASLIRQIVQG